MRDPAYEEIQTRLRELGQFCNGIIPHSIGGPGFEPEMSDARELQNDLRLLARRVDAVILAYGEYCRFNGIATDDDVKENFTDVLERAIDGNATYVIESRTEDRVQSLEHEAA